MIFGVSLRSRVETSFTPEKTIDAVTHVQDKNWRELLQWIEPTQAQGVVDYAILQNDDFATLWCSVSEELVMLGR